MYVYLFDLKQIYIRDTFYDFIFIAYNEKSCKSVLP